METDESTATPVKATRGRQTERIMKDLDNPGTTNSGSSSGSGQHKRVRFAGQERLDRNLGRDVDLETSGPDATATR